MMVAFWERYWETPIDHGRTITGGSVVEDPPGFDPRRVGVGLLSISYRQLKRVYSRYVLEGNSGLAHGLRFRPSNHLIGVERRQRILELYELKYGDFGPTLAVEYLLRDDGERVGIETLRRWLLAAGLWHGRRRGSCYRQWRERRAHWGELVQMDSSEHDWFEGRGSPTQTPGQRADGSGALHENVDVQSANRAQLTVLAKGRVERCHGAFQDQLNQRHE